MKNEIFERDYRITEKSKNTSSKKPNIINYAAESGFFKAYNDAMLKIPKYIVKETNYKKSRAKMKILQKTRRP